MKCWIGSLSSWPPAPLPLCHSYALYCEIYLKVGESPQFQALAHYTSTISKNWTKVKIAVSLNHSEVVQGYFQRSSITQWINIVIPCPAFTRWISFATLFMSGGNKPQSMSKQGGPPPRTGWTWEDLSWVKCNDKSESLLTESVWT